MKRFCWKSQRNLQFIIGNRFRIFLLLKYRGFPCCKPKRMDVANGEGGKASPIPLVVQLYDSFGRKYFKCLRINRSDFKESEHFCPCRSQREMEALRNFD
ncbi:hypothetical protein CDAR_297211 [Caerostris darwini]|uniref:Uncharacterized protein n=1 Tax=Caerostris darwini TaxID=1538125 RepID=A0AAV4PTZ7_9ARAC|nr:hypothetical protein CDAR_297211 [Caerostris darwini]